MLRLVTGFACLFVLAGCPKNVPDNVAGSEDEQMDHYGAQLEEARTRSSQDMKCDDWCSMKSTVCDTSAKVCDLAGKKAERADFQSKCVASQEDCAHFTDSCSSCKK
ncbi:MAG: hypothetical protein IPJ65_13165 [Archangiaceae bacterium]|nr:hypothetical protein [Archangiaceae bacterium]